MSTTVGPRVALALGLLFPAFASASGEVLTESDAVRQFLDRSPQALRIPLIEQSARDARERVVPILMTALSAGFALVPLALAGSHPGAELEAPMAVVILFGLISATALNMIVVPIAYLKFSRLRGRYGD